MNFVPAGAEGYCSDESDEFHFGDDQYTNDYTSHDSSPSHPIRRYGEGLLQTSRNQHLSGLNSRNKGIPRRDQRGSPLIAEDLKTAASTGNLEEVKNLLNRGMKVDAVLSGGWTALMYSVYSGQADVTSYLLERGTDVDYCSSEASFCPLLCCCSSKAKEDKLSKCLEMLLQHGVCLDVHDSGHMTPLMCAAQNRNVKLVSKLILAKSDPNKQDNRGWTALCYAALSRDIRLVRVLLDSGADATTQCSEGTAADIAYGQGCTEISEILDPFCNPGEASATAAVTSDIRGEEPSKTTASASTKGYHLYNDLDLFLCGLDVSELIPVFQTHKVDFAELLRLSEEDLEKMGIQQLGSRRKIMRSVHEIHKLKWERGSVRNPSTNVLSQQESLAILDNVSQHLSYITSCLDYIHINWSTHETLGVSHQDGSTLHYLSDVTRKLLVKTPKLSKSIQKLEKDVQQACEATETATADLILDAEVMSGRRWSHSRIVFLLSGVTIVTAALYFRYPEKFPSMPSR